MSKKLISIMLAMLFIVTMFAGCSSSDEEEDDYVYLSSYDEYEEITSNRKFKSSWKTDEWSYSTYEDTTGVVDEYIIIDAYKGEETELVIPAEIDGVQVLAVSLRDTEDTNTDYNNGITSITFSEGIAVIEQEGCAYMEGVETINFPDSLIYIDDHAFEYCTSLKTVNFGSGLQYIGIYVFRTCESLEEITLPESLTSLGGGSFRHCTALTSVTVLGSETEISSVDPFTDCSDDLVIYSLSGSLAETFAEENEYSFSVITEETEDEE